MSDLEYENDNKQILEACCQVMNKAAGEYTYKETKLKTRRRIEELVERKNIRSELELDC